MVRKVSCWVEAVKEWRKHNKHGRIPMKGTKEHSNIVKIMEKLKVKK